MTHIGTRRRVVVRRWATYSVFHGSCAKGRWVTWGCGVIREGVADAVWDLQVLSYISRAQAGWRDNLMTSALPQ